MDIYKFQVQKVFNWKIILENNQRYHNNIIKMSKTAIASSVGKLHNDLHVLFCWDSTMTFFVGCF
jgi:hypothetical protein